MAPADPGGLEAYLEALAASDDPADAEALEAAHALAGEALADLCQREDHRLCEAADCPHAALWWPRVVATGGEALARSGRAWAVLCCVPACSGSEREPRLLVTTDSLRSATGTRNSHYAAAHDGYERRGVASVHGWCPIVKATAGGPQIA